MKNNNSKDKSGSFFDGVLSFAIPVFVVALAFYGIGIYPGGSLTLFTYDLRYQLLPFYGYISNGGGPGFDNLLYSMSGGLGGGFLGTLALYISPFDFIYRFISLKILPDAVYFMVLAKIGMCGLAFFLYLKNVHENLNGILIITLSCCYALMSYNIAYYISPMWYDAVMLLPLIALASEKIINGNKSWLFVVLMTFCIISDYYMAYMVAVSLIIYVVFRLIETEADATSFVKRFAVFALHGILSFGLSLFVLIPVVLDFKRGKFLEGDFATSGSFIKNSIYDVLSSLMSQKYSGVEYDASPNIFFGTLNILAVLFWFVYGKKDIKARIAGGLIMVFYFMSFIFGPLDRMWHGFRDPVCFSCRYAFTFVFFMLLFAVRGINRLSCLKLELSSNLKKILLAAFVTFTLAELYVNASYILSEIGIDLEYTTRDEYDHSLDVSEHLIPYSLLSDASGYGRLFTDYRFTNNDNAMYAYDGFDRFSSSYNFYVSSLFRSFGVDTFYHTFNNDGITPPVSGLFGAKYFISAGKDLSYVYEPAASYDCYTLYVNNYAFPLAFETSISEGSAVSELTEDPFENINTVYGELVSTSGVFVPSDHSFTDEITLTGDEKNFYRGIEIRPEITGHYYLYSIYQSNGEEQNSDTDIERYTFCFDIGVLEGGETYNITLETDGPKAERVCIYCFDVEAYKNASDSVNGFDLVNIGSKGISLKGTVDSDSNVLVTLPYESGYNIYVDGKKSEYGSYRNCLLLIPVSAGEHIIEIGYFPPGMKWGIVLSLISLTAFILIFFHPQKRIR